jgi:hypothetical protein
MNWFSRIFSKEVEQVVDKVDYATSRVNNTIETYAEPVRKTAFRRFPVLFTLLAATGVAAVFMGLESLIIKIPLLRDNPSLMLVFGITILIITGTLYKKLDSRL